jgi:hypothetical protein
MAAHSDLGHHHVALTCGFVSCTLPEASKAADQSHGGSSPSRSRPDAAGAPPDRGGFPSLLHDLGAGCDLPRDRVIQVHDMVFGCQAGTVQFPLSISRMRNGLTATPDTIGGCVQLGLDRATSARPPAFNPEAGIKMADWPEASVSGFCHLDS